MRGGLRFWMLVVLSLLAVISSVIAIGVAPSERSFDFVPGKNINYDLFIINNAKEDLEVLIYSRGEYSENVVLDKQMIRMTEQDEKGVVKVSFQMPEKILEAGEHAVEIVAVGSTPSEKEGSIVKADIAVISRLMIDVPYPDKYIETRVHTLDTDVDDLVTFSVPVFNKGQEDIGSVDVVVDVYDSQGNVVDTLSSAAVALGKGEDHKFTIRANKNYPSGKYSAKLKVTYDELVQHLEEDFSVGEMQVELKSLVVEDFSLGGIAKFDMLLYNSWSEELNNIYAEMEITNSNNDVLTSFKTVAVDLPSKKMAPLEGYWYTQGVSPGLYTATIRLYFANRVEQKQYQLEVQPNKIITREMISGNVIAEPVSSTVTRGSYYGLLIFITVLVVIALVFRRRKKSGDAHAEEIAQLQKRIDELKRDEK